MPVVTASLKEKFSSRLDLFIGWSDNYYSLRSTVNNSAFKGAREFLRTFTDAANHIPRHRRTRCIQTAVLL